MNMQYSCYWRHTFLIIPTYVENILQHGAIFICVSNILYKIFCIFFLFLIIFLFLLTTLLSYVTCVLNSIEAIFLLLAFCHQLRLKNYCFLINRDHF